MRIFGGFCFARLLRLRFAVGQLCILRGSNLNHPHTLQRSWSTALLVPAPPQRFPISNHCHISPILGIAQATSFAIGLKNPPWPLLALLLLERQKLKNFEQILKKCFFGQSGNILSVLDFLGLWVAEFCGNSAEAGAPRRLLSRKAHFLALKTQKRQIWAANLRR